MAVELVTFFKVLADSTRLKIVGILASGERSVEELAELLQLRPPTVSHHLARLRRLGLVRMRAAGNSHLYKLDEDVLRTWSQELLSQQRVNSLAEDVDVDAWERKVLGDFLEGDRLREIPARQKKRLVVLRWLGDHFRPGERYPEAQVNEILARYHPDFATLRRMLVDEELMQRGGGFYWRAGTLPPPGPRSRGSELRG
jgi:DNA-binding transcriptional ArsR family regulator